MKENNYNSVAWCYDWLSKIVFGNSIKNVQTEMLPFIAKNSKLFVAGGGTGWILEEIAKVHSSGLMITYLDVSEEMISRSMKRNVGLNEIQFINRSIEEVQLKDNYYDVIVTPFFLDNFSQPVCKVVFEKLHQGLQPGGKWLFSDFYIKNKKRFWQRSMIKFMYLFFKITCRIQASKLPDTDSLFYNHSYKMIRVKYFGKMLISKVFKK